MSYQIYSTEGLVLSSSNTGEADKLYTIFTREFGMVTAKATGVRKLESKLRFVMRDQSLVGINLVYGKIMWRLTNASEILSFPLSKDTRYMLAKVFRFVRRMIPGEEANEPLFINLTRDIEILGKLPRLTKGDLDLLEIILVFRILFHTGYIAREDWNKDFIDESFSIAFIDTIVTSKKKLIGIINQSITESHL